MFLPGFVPIITPQPKQELDPMPTLDPMPDIASSSGLDPMPQLDPMPDISAGVESNDNPYVKRGKEWVDQSFSPALKKLQETPWKDSNVAGLNLLKSLAWDLPGAAITGSIESIPVFGKPIAKGMEGLIAGTSRYINKASQIPTNQSLVDMLSNKENIDYILKGQENVAPDVITQRVTGFTPEQQKNEVLPWLANFGTEALSLGPLLAGGAALHSATGIRLKPGKAGLPNLPSSFPARMMQDKFTSENYNKPNNPTIRLGTQPLSPDMLPRNPLSMPNEVPEKGPALTRSLDPQMLPPELQNIPLNNKSYAGEISALNADVVPRKDVNMEPFYRIIDNIVEQEAKKSLRDAVKQIEPQPVLDPMPNLMPDLTMDPNLSERGFDLLPNVDNAPKSLTPDLRLDPSPPMQPNLTARGFNLSDMGDVQKSLTPKLEISPIDPNNIERGFRLISEGVVIGEIPPSLLPDLKIPPKPPIQPNTTERGFQLVPEASVTTRTLKTPSDSIFADWFPKGRTLGMGGGIPSWKEMVELYDAVKNPEIGNKIKEIVNMFGNVFDNPNVSPKTIKRVIKGLDDQSKLFSTLNNKTIDQSYTDIMMNKNPLESLNNPVSNANSNIFANRSDLSNAFNQAKQYFEGILNEKNNPISTDKFYKSGISNDNASPKIDLSQILNVENWLPKGNSANRLNMGGIPSLSDITNAYEGVKGFIENNKSKVEDLGYALLKRGSAVKAAADPIHILNSTLNNAPGQARQLFNVNLRETGENVKYASPLNIAELANTRPESVREFMRAASNDESLRRRYDMGQDVLWTDSKGTQHTIPYSPELQQATKLMSDNWNEVRNLSEQTGIVGSALRQLSYDPRAEAAYALGKLPLAELEALKKQGLHPDIEAIVDGLINDDPFFDSMNQSKQLSAGGSGRDTDGFKARTGAWGPDVPKEQVFAMRQMQLHRVGAYAQAAQALRKAGVTSDVLRPGMVEIKIDSQSSLARLFEKQLKGSDYGVFQLPDGQWGIKKLPLGDMVKEAGAYKSREAAQKIIDTLELGADKYIDRGTLMELNDTFGGGRESIQKLSRASDVAGRWYGKLGYSLFKTGMTAWNIKTMLNNGIWTSNMIFTKLGAKGLNPARLKEVYDVLKNPNDVRQAAFQRSGASHSYNVELSQGSKVPDVNEAFANSDPASWPKWRKAWSITKEVIKKPGDAYGYIDTHGKANIFMHELESKYDMRSNEMIRKSDGKRITGPDKFDDVDIANFREAGKEANWWLIDYTRQSRALKAYRSLPGGAPFATFYVDMLPKIPQLMLGYGPKGFNAAQLARFWVLPATMILLNEYSKGKLNLSDADESRLRDALPEGQKAPGIGNMVSTNPAVNKIVNPLLSGPLLPTTGKNNMPMYMPTQGFLPFAAPMQTKGIITQLPAFMAPFQDPLSTAVGMAAHNREPYSKKDVVADPGNDPEASNKLIDKLIEKNVPYVAGIKRYRKAKAGISPNPYSPPEDPNVVTAAVLSPFRGKEIDEGRAASYTKYQYDKMKQIAKKEYTEAVKNIVLSHPDNPQEAQRLIAIETQNYNKRFGNFMKRTYPNQIRKMTGSQ